MYATFALIALISFVFSLVALLDVRWISIPRDPLLGIQSNWGLFRMCISSSGKSGTTSCQLFPSPDCSVPTDPSRDFTPCQAWIVARWVYLLQVIFIGIAAVSLLASAVSTHVQRHTGALVICASLISGISCMSNVSGLVVASGFTLNAFSEILKKDALFRTFGGVFGVAYMSAYCSVWATGIPPAR
ncbi:MAG: hypothetical protein SGCHY_002995 [Lobulomycetales sp.]